MSSNPEVKSVVMPTSPSFRVEIEHNMIKVDLEGIWDLAIDIDYLDALSQAMRKLKDQSWVLFVDMRGWVVPEDIVNFESRINIQMDRSNQEVECWIVDDMQQGEHILHYIQQAGIPFERFMDEDSANDWLVQYGYTL